MLRDFFERERGNKAGENSCFVCLCVCKFARVPHFSNLKTFVWTTGHAGYRCCFEIEARRKFCLLLSLALNVRATSLSSVEREKGKCVQSSPRRNDPDE